MTATPPPTDNTPLHTALLEEASWLCGALIVQFSAGILPPSGRRPGIAVLRHLLRQLLLPAESLLRRAIWLIAATLAPLPARAAAANQAAHPRAGGGPERKERKPRAPLFRLAEPLPHPYTNYMPVNQRPQISIAGLAPRPPSRPGATLADPEILRARLMRRFGALVAAWNNPHASARRLQRRRARTPETVPRLNLTKIPGAGSRPMRSADGQILRELNDAVSALALSTVSSDTS